MWVIWAFDLFVLFFLFIYLCVCEEAFIFTNDGAIHAAMHLLLLFCRQSFSFVNNHRLQYWLCTVYTYLKCLPTTPHVCYKLCMLTWSILCWFQCLFVWCCLIPCNKLGMSDVSPLSGISGLSFDSTLLSPLLFFCLVLLLSLSYLLLPAGPFFWTFPRKFFNIFS